MKRKRKVFHPPARSPKGTAPAARGEYPVSPTLAVINLTAGRGRKGVVVGSRVTILGSGLYAGELAVVERVAGGPIPSAVVRTDAGRTRQVRTVDLEPATAAASATAASETARPLD